MKGSLWFVLGMKIDVDFNVSRAIEVVCFHGSQSPLPRLPGRDRGYGYSQEPDWCIGI